MIEQQPPPPLGFTNVGYRPVYHNAIIGPNFPPEIFTYRLSSEDISKLMDFLSYGYDDEFDPANPEKKLMKKLHLPDDKVFVRILNNDGTLTWKSYPEALENSIYITFTHYLFVMLHKGYGAEPPLHNVFKFFNAVHDDEGLRIKLDQAGYQLNPPNQEVCLEPLIGSRISDHHIPKKLKKIVGIGEA